MDKGEQPQKQKVEHDAIIYKHLCKMSFNTTIRYLMTNLIFWKTKILYLDLNLQHVKKNLDMIMFIIVTTPFLFTTLRYCLENTNYWGSESRICCLTYILICSVIPSFYYFYTLLVLFFFKLLNAGQMFGWVWVWTVGRPVKYPQSLTEKLLFWKTLA